MNKNGMSQVVSTIILVLLILVAVSAVWFAVDNLILSGAEKINIEKFTLDLKLKSVVVDFDTGMATVRVARNPGEGELVGIKFIVEDNRNSEVFEEPVENFFELVERTFDLNISERTNLILEDVEKISIAPVYISGTNGIETLGGITDTVEGLNIGISLGEEEEEEPIAVCKEDIDCGADYFIENSEICSQDLTTVLQYKIVFICDLGFCTSSSQTAINDTCISGEICYDGACILDAISCTEDTVSIDCGEDSLVGIPRCALVGEAVVQDFRDYSCVNELCGSADSEILIEECVEGDICHDGACFTPLDCTKNEDCNACEICEEGLCVTESVLNSGVIRSAWPFGIGEYFDSPDLPALPGTGLIGKYVLFPGSVQTGCLTIKDHVIPPEGSEGLIAYVRLSEPETNISDGDNYEVWETTCAC